jgi:hypothetical protein
MEDIQTAAAKMKSIAEEILRQAGEMPEECIHWKPGPEVWTVMDNLCHIAEFVPYWTSQVEQVILHPDREWGRTHHDADRLAAVADTASCSLTRIKDQLLSRVENSAATLRKYTPAQFAVEAPSRNPRWGVKPASFIVEMLLVTHLENHLGQIRRNLAQYKQQQDRPAEGDVR